MQIMTIGRLGALWALALHTGAAVASPRTPAEDFALLDLDRDGTLDWKEYRNRVSEIFFFADADSDGRVQGEEAAALGEGVAVREGGISHADFLDEQRAIFQRLDRDGDGRLSLAEATAR